MSSGPERLVGAMKMGLGWAVGWAITGGLIGMTSLLLPELPWRVFFVLFDAPLPALAIPGAFAGLIFSVVLGVAERTRVLRELPLARAAIWGAVSGFLCSLIPLVMVLVGLAHISFEGLGLWQHALATSSWLTPLSAVSGCVTWVVSRAAAR